VSATWLSPLDHGKPVGQNFSRRPTRPGPCGRTVAPMDPCFGEHGPNPYVHRLGLTDPPHAGEAAFVCHPPTQSCASSSHVPLAPPTPPLALRRLDQGPDQSRQRIRRWRTGTASCPGAPCRRGAADGVQDRAHLRRPGAGATSVPPADMRARPGPCADGRPPTVQYCGTCRDLRHGRGGCQAGACAGGCVKVCARCLHAYHDTRICSECPAAETGKCSSHVCLHPGTRAAHVRASAGCDACPPGSGCSAVPQPPADALAVMADAGSTDMVGDSLLLRPTHNFPPLSRPVWNRVTN